MKENIINGSECYKEVEGILIGYKYLSPYVKGWYRPEYVDKDKDFVVFYHNPGWIGNWYWMTSIDNFKKNFTKEYTEPKRGTISGIEYVSITNGFDHPEVIKGQKTFKEAPRV